MTEGFVSRRREAEQRTKQLERIAMLAAANYVKGMAQTYSRKRSGDTARSITAETRETTDGIVGLVGSNQDNAIYEEFGTGIHAEKGGRKSPWVYKDKRTGKFYRTKGKKGTRALRNAGEMHIADIQRIIKQSMKGGLGG
ncbi:MULTISPECIES: HK97 gp10 family phage protein [unclassified Bacillus cereus group]|uniref:HK97 gp10 family phage protein n=1 Tax=unclassified Bacillus cereus group TaxID=2750818 RepID=UPI001F57AB59|nr:MULTISPECIES: HK97 gp10 family phage protein [unclassified Bacillus cereus group]